ncbi:3'-5' exonuclease [Pseudomonas capsici]|uniref:3'-5' exonuclease n=1 Tax=Pseudomonas capsici TaxID=2810614 RepID=UPI0021F205E8|nr:3'-5' exonuclease [Pseudomonas capsici]MCV4342638.1 UvrD-helicase domain-containing protein [Pseudomonas capsici]
MNFRIADTFTDSLARLTGDEQKAVKTTAFDLQINPASTGMSFHKLEKSKDKNFWSLRVSADIRLIVHKTESSLLLCYVDHHDKAYQWAERRKLETHPKTGAAQLVEVRERVEDVVVPKFVEYVQPELIKPLLFNCISEDQLLSYGVPIEWLPDVKKANEDTLLQLADHLPAEAAEALLELATGGVPVISRAVVGNDPFAHPDALRRFRVMADVDALTQALDSPWEKWTVFLHPAQQQMVERDYTGPVRVSGSAGTGKTIVALHRAVFLARHYPDCRVLLTTFSDTLANALHTKLRHLCSRDPRLAERLEVHAMNTIGQRLFERNFGRANLVEKSQLLKLIAEASSLVTENKFSLSFLLAEWEQVVDVWQLKSWEAYRDVKRLGRKTRLPEVQRQLLWSVFERVLSSLEALQLITAAEMFAQLSTRVQESKNPAFEFVVVDEAQDINVAQLRFLAALGGNRPNALFFAGDLGQRIFQQAFSWRSLGVDVRGRSRTLNVNYRTSHQIRMQADKLLGPEVSDVDGVTECRGGTVSVFNGPKPEIHTFSSEIDESAYVAQWLKSLLQEGVLAHEIGVFVRSTAEVNTAINAVEAAGLAYKVLDDYVETVNGCVSITTMHLAKGLEFRSVVVMACDDEVIPSQERIENVTDDADLKDVYETERQLLYVACTRARDRLLVTSGGVPSEFLEDMV